MCVARWSTMCGQIVTLRHGGREVEEEIVLQHYADASEQGRVDAATFEYLVGIGAVATQFAGQPCWCALLADEFV